MQAGGDNVTTSDDPGFDEDLWFLRRGVPMLVSGSPTSNPARIWRRALPALLMLYVIVLFRGLIIDDRGVAVEAMIGGSILLATWIVSNLIRKQRLFSYPNGLGPFELTAFVLGPSISSLLTTEVADSLLEGDSLEIRLLGAGLVVVFQLLVLGAVWVGVSFGIVSLSVWLLRELGKTLGATGVALARSVPPLLGVVTFFFLTAEVWQSIGLLRWFPLMLLILLFTVLGSIFIARARNLDIEALATFESLGALRSALLDSSLKVPSMEANASDFPMICPLSKRQRANLVVVAVVSRLLVSVVVAVLVGAFFVVFGFLTVNADVVKAWTLQDPREILSIQVPSRRLALTWEHINVAGFLATFSGFYFTIVSAADPALRAGLRDTAEDGIREACAARLALGTVRD